MRTLIRREDAGTARCEARKGNHVPRDFVVLDPSSRADWRAWLRSHHRSAVGIRLLLDKKASGTRRLSVEEAVEEGLCFGWIDSTLHPTSDDRFVLDFTPRRPGSTWSRANRERVRSLTERGLMTDAGLLAGERAHRDGSWTALDEIDALLVPEDLAAAFASEPDAKDNFDRFTVSTRRATLWWIKSAKRHGTRATRIAETVRLAADNKTVRQRASLPEDS